MSEQRTTATFAVPCPHCGRHRWQWADLEGPAVDLLRKAAREQLATACPAVGGVLTYEPIRDEIYSPGIWTLRQGARHIEDGETIIATCLGSEG
jgi:phage terminase large subunit GpA-like protein